MLGNRVKRKLDEDDEGLEDDGCLLDVSGVSQTSYALQRQTVLNMSLMKLYGPRMGGNVGLQRSILINNIIRRIHDDFRQEGGIGALFLSAPLPAAAAAESSSSMDSSLTSASLLEEDLPMFFTLPPSSSTHLHHSPRPPLSSSSSKDSFSTALEDIEELCPPSSSLSSPFSSPPSSPPARVLSDVIMKEEGQDFQQVETRSGIPPPPPLLPGTILPSTPVAFLTDFTLDDALFRDIDTSMYDLGPGPPPTGTPPTKVASVLMADNLVRSMSGYGGGTQNQPFKMDLTELDHIMEVLVGS